MDVRLDSKVAVVTGGGGAFGRAYSRGLAEAGADIAVVDLNPLAAEAVVVEIRETGGCAEAFRADVTVASEVQRLFEQVVARFKGVDILLNIAGDSSKYDLKDLPESEWDRILDLNLKSIYLCCKSAIPHLIARGGGRIINMASSRGLFGQLYGAHYAASKGGIIALTKSLAEELRSFRITVNALGPGATDTPMWRRGRSAEAAEQARRSGRVGRPDDLTPIVVLLASDLGYQITGQMLTREIYMPREVE
jgi:NAD(P)-dependent dehydrogenase (short-subunit alcohol dehydrogenase family)